jgi:hypothetical protein
MRKFIESVAANRDEAALFTGVVFANPDRFEAVVSDRDYGGKTVDERLAGEGLVDRFAAARQAGDRGTMVELLEKVAIAKRWAGRLVEMILDEAEQPSIHLSVNDPRNVGLKHIRNEHSFPACMRPRESPRDPYLHLGSHPDVVDRLWKTLRAALPQDCRCVVFGTPALVAPRSGVLLAQACGTAYLLRVPKSARAAAIESGAQTKMVWSNKSVIDAAETHGDDWIFGRYLDLEPTWLRAMYDTFEAAAE